MKTPHFWQTKNLLSTALLPFAACYSLGFALDRRFTKKLHAPLPVISVGNVTAGGAGKTPTVIALVEMLRSMGEVPHIITRGYGGSITTTHRVLETDTAAQVGDEALLLARHAPTWVGHARIDSTHAAKQAGATLVIADDALQHHALAHDLCVLVVDLAYGLGNQRQLPSGPLRQTLASAYDGAPTIAIAIGSEDPHQLVPQLRILGEVWRATMQPSGDVSWLKNGPWLAFAGIAHPQKFYATLRDQGADLVHTVDFPDHHPFATRELALLQASANENGWQLITTEKDAVRGLGTIAAQTRTLPIALKFDEPAALLETLRAWRSST